MSWAARGLHWCIQRVFFYLLWQEERVIFEIASCLGLNSVTVFMNEEFLVNASHQLALNTSLPFVHTARRSYRLNDPVKRTDCKVNLLWFALREVRWTLLFRGRRSRNKVSVGEPAEGSFTVTSVKKSGRGDGKIWLEKGVEFFIFSFAFFLLFSPCAHVGKGVCWLTWGISDLWKNWN